jgi:drug/metabolite transporter (DMT)-like permease
MLAGSVGAIPAYFFMKRQKKRHPAQGSNWTTSVMLLAGMTVFGSATPFSRLVSHDFAPFLGGLFRVLIGTTVLAILAASAWRQIFGISLNDWLRIGAIAVFGMFGFSALMLFGMKLAPGAIGATVMSMAPAVTAGASMLFRGERPSWRKLLAIALAIAGAAILELGQGLDGENGNAVMFGALLVFAAICCEAAYTLIGQRVTTTVDPVLTSALASALSIPLFLFGAIAGGRWNLPHATAPWAALIWYGAGTLALGSWLWYRAIPKVSGVTAAAFMGVMPLSALLLSYVLLGEPVRSIHIIGFATVFVGVTLMSWEHARMSKSQ